MTVTSGGNPINNGGTVDVVEEDDFNFTCSTLNTAVDIALTVIPDIDVHGSPIDSTRDFYLINVQHNLTGTVFTCADSIITITFTLNVLCWFIIKVFENNILFYFVQ